MSIGIVKWLRGMVRGNRCEEVESQTWVRAQVLPIDKATAQATCRHEWYFGRCWRCDATEYTDTSAYWDTEKQMMVWVHDPAAGPGVIR